jgi:hypothetical protein
MALQIQDFIHNHPNLILFIDLFSTFILILICYSLRSKPGPLKIYERKINKNKYDISGIGLNYPTKKN